MEITKTTYDTKVKLTRGMAGKYGWEITTYGENWEAEFDAIDTKLREKDLNDAI